MRENGMITLTENEWAKAKQRNDVIRPLAELDIVGQAAAMEAATQLDMTVRQIYRLIKLYKGGTGLVTDLAPGSSSGGKGKTRITPEVEQIIADVIKALYLSRQKLSKAAITREIRMRCKHNGHRQPSYNTINQRISILDPVLIARKREGGDAVRRLLPASGETPESAGPLERVQIDHTPVDVIVVDKSSREPIGRPHLTLAIDTFTRCIVGMLLTLEAPSATSVGLCLAHTVTDKAAWLERLGLDIGIWPMTGKPKLIHVDNGPEFHSDALKRGCEQHGIERDYRPKKQPHYGGIIERVIGTAMTMAHEVPGTTFSNTQQRGSYKSEARAVLTLKELEKWLVLAIGTYHHSVHNSLLEPPATVWKRSVQSWTISDVPDKQSFLIDFLPVIRRKITRTGFVIDHISYYGDALKPLIASRDRASTKFVIRRDPRDLSRVWVLDPDSKLYFEIPYRTLSRPAVTLWEHRQAIENLRKQGREQVDEVTIFRMIEKMREITDSAARESKRARRDKNRRGHLDKRQANKLQIPDDVIGQGDKVKPFDIEDWNQSLETNFLPSTDGQVRRIKPFDVEEW